MSKRSAADPARTRTALLGRFVKQLTGQGLAEQTANEYANVVGSAIDFKSWFFGDASPVRWPQDMTIALISELMPPKVVADETYARSVVPAMRAYLEHLVSSGRLKSSRDEAHAVVAALSRDEERIVAAYLAGGASAGERVADLARREGLDMGDEDQLADFVNRFEAMSPAERDRLLGVSSRGPATPSTPDAQARESVSGITGLDVGEPVVHLRRVADDEEARALGALPLWDAIAGVLRWLVRGRRTGEDAMPRAEELPALFAELGEPSAPASLWDVPWGAELWLTMCELDLIRDAGGIALPGPAAASWPGSGPGTLRQGRDLVAAFATTAYLVVALHGKSQPELGDAPAGAFMVGLAFAAQPGGMAIVEHDVDPADPDAGVAEIAQLHAHEGMATLEWAGILCHDLTGTRWLLRPGLHRAIAPLFESAPMAVSFD